jgi:hypothetical protein
MYILSLWQVLWVQWRNDHQAVPALLSIYVSFQAASKQSNQLRG